MQRVRERERERESIRHIRVIERSRAFTRRERASSVRTVSSRLNRTEFTGAWKRSWTVFAHTRVIRRQKSCRLMSYCAPPGAISVNFGPHRFSPPIYRRFAHPHTIPPFEWRRVLDSFLFVSRRKRHHVLRDWDTLVRDDSMLGLLFLCYSWAVGEILRVFSLRLCYVRWINCKKRTKYFHFVSFSNIITLLL